jgi:NTE family protein
VLQELRDTRVVVDGQSTRLLDEVDEISGVSGGSFPTAYYRLYGDRIFEDFEEKFLRKNVEGALIRQMLIPWNALALMTPALDRTLLASRYYSRHVFDHATFADVAAASGPEIFINSTDLVSAQRFTFSQIDFDAICSDLSVFPLSHAVAASSAVPGVLSPLTLKNYAGRCGFEQPAWFKEALASRRTDPRRYHAAKSSLPYFDPDKKKYIHLVDGGVADNLGLRVALERTWEAGGIEQMRALQGVERPDHIIVIVVDAETVPPPDHDLRAAPPGLFGSLTLTTGAMISRYTFDTLELMREILPKWAEQLSTPDQTVTAHFVDVSFDFIDDEKERSYLKHLPTSFKLSNEQVDHLIRAGRTILRESPEFKGILDALR